MVRKFVAFLVMLFSLPHFAQAERLAYETPIHKAEWLTEGSKTYCQLRHPIHQYGEAIFHRDAGGELQFRLSVDHPPRAPQLALLSSTPTDWGHQHRTNLLTDVEFAPENTPLIMGVAGAHRLLQELEKGKSPEMEYVDWHDGRDEIQVRLSNVNFLTAKRIFNFCVTNLLDFNFDEIQQTVIYFENDKAELTEGSKNKIAKLSRFLKAAPETIRSITIAGHTDSNADVEYNDTLSQHRAEAVNKSFLANGVDMASFNVNWHSELKPVASNLSPEGRARNRRTEITLIAK